MENLNKIERINGRILQIIPPEKHNSYLLPYYPHNEDSPFYGYTFIKISQADIPIRTFKSIIGCFFWKLFHRTKEEKKTWTLVSKNCENLKEGDIIDLNAERYFEPTEIFINQSEDLRTKK